MLRYAGRHHESGSSAIGIAAAVVVLWLAANVSRGQEVPPVRSQPAATSSASSNAPKAKIQQAIADLGSADFAIRERASQALWKAGAEAEAALEKAVRESDDFEVVCRARKILDSFQVGIYPDTPAEIVMLIGQFRMGNLNVKGEAVRHLKAKGKTDLVRRLIAKESNPYVREQLNQLLAGEIGAAGVPFYVPGSLRRRVRHVADASELATQARLRLARHDLDAAERVLRDATDDASVRDYAALLLSRGKTKLDDAIKQLRGNLKATDAAAQRRLAWMLRANGDLPGAIAAAKLVDDSGLIEDLLVEVADWKELAKVNAKADIDALAARPDGTQKLARIMLFRHLAGEKQACDLAAAGVVKVLKQRHLRDSLGALVLTDRIDQAIEASQPRDVRNAFELLAAQNRIKEAFHLVKIDVPVAAKIDWTAWLKDGKEEVTLDRRLLAHHVVRTLHVAGEDEKAQELIAALLAMLTEKLSEEGWEGEAPLLMDVAVAVGPPESNDALAAKLLALDLRSPEMVISRLYRDQDTLAILLWEALRKQFPTEDRQAALKHLRRLLTGKPGAQVIEELGRIVHRIEPQLEAENSDASADDETSDPRARKLLALATLFHRYDQGKLVKKYLALIGTAGVSAQPLIEEGNLYAEDKQWIEAAKAYEAAWTKDRRSASALYLLGWAQGKRGEDVEGRKQMELALVIPLADGKIRRDLVRTLVRLHQDDEAARQRQWLLHLAAPHDFPILQTLIETGDDAAEKSETAGMAVVWQRAAVELLIWGNACLDETRYYFHPPASARGARACDLLRVGKTAEAIEEIRTAEAIQPDNIQLAIDCDAELRKHGAGGEAEALYRRMVERHEAFCRDFPRSGTCHNDLAWLAASLDRDLDKALAHAQRAVELEPQSAGILDTLAEVHFRRGNRAEAVRLTRRCLEMEPDGEHYKKQLARFEK